MKSFTLRPDTVNHTELMLIFKTFQVPCSTCRATRTGSNRSASSYGSARATTSRRCLPCRNTFSGGGTRRIYRYECETQNDEHVV